MSDAVPLASNKSERQLSVVVVLPHPHPANAIAFHDYARLPRPLDCLICIAPSLSLL